MARAKSVKIELVNDRGSVWKTSRRRDLAGVQVRTAINALEREEGEIAKPPITLNGKPVGRHSKLILQGGDCLSIDP